MAELLPNICEILGWSLSAAKQGGTKQKILTPCVAGDLDGRWLMQLWPWSEIYWQLGTRYFSHDRSSVGSDSVLKSQVSLQEKETFSGQKVIELRKFIFVVR